jgi:hypothetical protein
MSASRRKQNRTAKPKGRLRVIKPSALSLGISEARVKSYSAAMLTTIKRELGNAIFFTREDVLQLGVFNYVGTAYRINLISIMVRHLVSRGDLILKSKTDICLPSHERGYSETPLRQQYYDTIRGVISSMPTRSHASHMDIVALWKTDQHLTINNKRVAVRGAIVRLIKEGHISRRNDFEFTVLRKAT